MTTPPSALMPQFGLVGPHTARESGAGPAETPQGSSSREERLLLLCSIGAAALIAAVWVLASPTILADEAWFAQVAARVAAGETLYRDVWVGVTPLTIWGVALLSKVFGANLIAVKVFSAVMFVATAAIATLTCRALRLSTAETVGVLGLVLLVCPPGQAGAGSGYNTASVPALLACLLVAVQWWQRRDTDAIPLAFIAGLVAGIAFGVKQNVGFFTMMAFSATVILAPAAGSTRMRRRTLLAAWVAFAGVGAILALVMLANGAIGPALSTWFGKGGYLAIGGINPLQGLRIVVWSVRAEQGWARILLVLRFAVYPTVIAGLAVPLVALFRNRGGVGWVGLWFGIVAIASAFPRYDWTHVALIAPLSVLCAAVGWAAWRGSRPVSHQIAWVVSSAVVLAALLVTVAVAADWLLVRVPVPAAALGTGRVSVAQRDAITATVTSLAGVRGKRVFVVSGFSGLYSLSAGLRNPLPWDYPLADGMPVDAATKLAQAVESGGVDAVWLDASLSGQKSEPTDVESWVRSRMQESMRTPYGGLYVPRK